MISRRRLGRLFAPTAGFRKATLGFLAGIAAFAIGSALSFKLLIGPSLESLQDGAQNLLRAVVPDETLDLATHLLGGAFLALGMYLLFISVRAGVRQITGTLDPRFRGGMVDTYVRRQQLAHGPRIVALGGGTGLSTLLRGLKQHTSNLTAIVTVSDDGGSSGRLVTDKGMIPPGDIRNCLVALADAEKSMTDLFQHRFQVDSGSLSGHSMGNLLIAALVDQAHGDFERAIEIASDVLAIRGRVVPATLSHVQLRAEMEDGTEVRGETKIAQAGQRIRQLYLDPAEVEAHASALAAIAEADLICIGPGSVYTSLIPNLLVPGIADAIHASGAKKAYICNVMTQPGESDAFSACEHVVALQNNVRTRVCDYVLVNTGVPSSSSIEKYKGSGQFLVEADIDRIRAMGFRVLAANLTSETDFVRHDPMRVAAVLMRLVGK